MIWDLKGKLFRVSTDTTFLTVVHISLLERLCYFNMSMPCESNRIDNQIENDAAVLSNSVLSGLTLNWAVFWTRNSGNRFFIKKMFTKEMQSSFSLQEKIIVTQHYNPWCMPVCGRISALKITWESVMELTGVKTYTSKIIREDLLSLRVGFLSEASVHHTGLFQLKRGLTSNVRVTDAHYTKLQKKENSTKRRMQNSDDAFQKSQGANI